MCALEESLRADLMEAAPHGRAVAAEIVRIGVRGLDDPAALGAREAEPVAEGFEFGRRTCEHRRQPANRIGLAVRALPIHAPRPPVAPYPLRNRTELRGGKSGAG